MGTTLRIVIGGLDRAAAMGLSERVVAAIEETESRLSTWRDDSELAQLNRAPVGQRVALTAALEAELRRAWRCFSDTKGAFDPSVGPLVAAWGLREGGRQPAASELVAAREATGFEALGLGDRFAVRGHPGLVLDAGGFGKGAGLMRALEAVAESGAAVWALLDLGGQVAVFGTPPGGSFTIDVADPLFRDRVALSIDLDHGSVATSGNSERGIVVDGRHLGHLLDPRTGRPAPDRGSLTVWTQSPFEADCLATGLYVLGPDVALAWAAARPGVEVLALETVDGRIVARATAGMAQRIRGRLVDTELEIVTAGHRAGEEPRTEGFPQHKVVPLRPH